MVGFKSHHQLLDTLAFKLFQGHYVLKQKFARILEAFSKFNILVIKSNHCPWYDTSSFL